MKTLLTLAALGLLFWIVRQQWRRLKASRPPPPTPVQRMVPCARCGLYLPQDEAIAQGGLSYCCPEHRDDAGRV